MEPAHLWQEMRKRREGILEQHTLDQYEAVRERAGLLELEHRGKLKVTGPDRVSFLHAMISNEVQNLPDFSGRYGTFLTATGKIVADFFYYRLPELILIDIQKDLLRRFAETLEKYIIMDDVTLQDVSADWAHLSIQGPHSPEILEKLLGTRGPTEPYGVEPSQWEGQALWVIRKNQPAEVGYELMLGAGTLPDFRQALLEAGEPLGLLPVGWEAYQLLRVERGIPLYGVDMDERNYPMEARLEEAISLTKGCFIGQEVVAKATYIGGVARQLVRLRLQGDRVPRKDDPVLVPGEEKRVGQVTSAVWSPRLQIPIALAYVRRAHSQPGTLLEVEVEGEGRAAAQVVDRFF